jgi:hypothetical protein
MLNPELAQERLKQFRIADWQTRKLKQILDLPEPLKQSGLAGLSWLPNWLTNVGRLRLKNAPQPEDLEMIEIWSVEQRLQLFAIFFPGFAPTVEAAWQLLKQMPYQIGYARRPFRAATDPQVSLPKRVNWLGQLINAVDGFDQDLPWYAAWAPYLSYYTNPFVPLFTAAINQEDALGTEILEILMASARGEHEIGAMGHHVCHSLLSANLPSGWEMIANLLLAAQRQEGLRQTILETVDEAHPQAFIKILKLILSKNLTRFSATIGAFDVWLGFGMGVLEEKSIRQMIQQILDYLEYPPQLQTALSSDLAETVYLALWATAYTNAMTAIPLATQLLTHQQASHRFVAVHFLAQLDLDQARLALLPMFADPDLVVAGRAIQAFSQFYTEETTIADSDAFERLEAVIEHFPTKPQRLNQVWDWLNVDVSQNFVAVTLISVLGKRSPRRLVPYLEILEPYRRSQVAQLLAQHLPAGDPETQAIFLKLVGDPSYEVQSQAIDILQRAHLNQEELTQLEQLLTRKSSRLRQGILGLFLKQTDTLKIAQRLLATKTAPQRLAGLELLREMVSQNRDVAICQATAKSYEEKRAKLSNPELQLIKTILSNQAEVSLTDALGLAPERTPAIPPEPKSVTLITDAAIACLKALDELIEQHRQTPVKIKNWQDQEEEYLFGSLDWQMPSHNPNCSQDENLEQFLLADVWLNWWQNRSSQLRDLDGLELIRAISPKMFTDRNEQPRYPQLLTKIVTWLLYLEPPSHACEFVLDVISDSLSQISPQDWQNNDGAFSLLQPQFNLDAISDSLSQISPQDWQNASWTFSLGQPQHPQIIAARAWIDYAQQLPFDFSAPATAARYWQYLRWFDEQSCSFYPTLRLWDVVAAYEVGAASQADLIFFLVGMLPLLEKPEPQEVAVDELAMPDNIIGSDEIFEDVTDTATSINVQLQHYLQYPNIPASPIRTDFQNLAHLTHRKSQLNYANYPFLLEIVDQIRQRVLEVELQRGDLPTAASSVALSLHSVIGIPSIIKIMQALDTAKLVRGYIYNNLTKPAVLSHLMRVSFPAAAETPSEFAEQAKQANIPEERLIQLALFAPQWANYVQQALEWPGFTEAVWWLHAHTKDTSWFIDQEVRDTWTAQIGERTPLDATELLQGAVDVAWFQQAYATLGAERWQQIYNTAQYTSSGTGHQRAKQFSDAMLKHLGVNDLVKRITDKRHQDSVRALGLVPLAQSKNREADLLNRYQVMQEFLRSSKQFGSQRRESERLAVTIGLANLARTAGYIDPLRLQWAMELQEIADLARGPISVSQAETTVTLSVNSLGNPELTIVKNGKSLKAIPAALKKQPEILALTTRRQELQHQGSRMHQSLEQAMCRGDWFTIKELQQLTQHPVLWPMLAQLVWVGEAGSGEIGYLDSQVTGLINYDGSFISLTTQQLRIAHPADLLASQVWTLWQQACFSQARTQPFKQIFRELYVLTAAEQKDIVSRRYEGHQVNPQQARALLGQRGWLVSMDGDVHKVFHHAKLMATLEFTYGAYTPLEMEGLTVATVQFHYQDNWHPLPLQEIPPILFSEVMRDLDLVVSVAHQGGVDIETTASTVEMRTSLVRETIRLMQLNNVQIQSNHVLIEGKLGSYSVHLGSAIVHRQPGGALCIVPVPAQHRGRIFLPFVDPDPKTAEVISKVLLLAKDSEIKDPTILEQIL